MPPITVEELNTGHQIKVREYRNRRIGDFLKELHLTEGRCTGIPKIQRSMRDNGSPEAQFDTDEDRSYFLTTLPIHPLLRLSKPSKSTQSKAKSTQSKAKSTRSKAKSAQSKAKSTRSKAKSAQSKVKGTQLTKENEIAIKDKLSTSLQRRLKALKPHVRKEKLHPLIIDICTIQPFSAAELAQILGRKSKKALVRDHLTPLKKENRLKVVNPKASAANQKYRTEKKKK